MDANELRRHRDELRAKYEAALAAQQKRKGETNNARGGFIPLEENTAQHVQGLDPDLAERAARVYRKSPIVPK